MDGYSPQRLRNHPRDNRTLQPRSERCRRKGKSHDHGKSQGDYCGIQNRQKALDGTRGNGRLPQESQSNKRSRKYALRTLARHSTESVSSQNHRINRVCPCSKGKAHEARHPFAQGNHDRIRRRHESIQGMGFDKGRYRCVKGCGVYRREANQPNSGSLRGTKDHPRLDYSPARTASRNQRATTRATGASSIGTPRFRFRFGRTRNGRPSSPIARILSKGASDRRNGKRINTKGIRTTRQRDLHLHEISRRKVQQRTTNSHGKDCAEHRSKRRGRASNGKGSSQPSHTRKAVGESHSGRSQLSNQEPYMGSCPTPSGPSNRHQQIRIQAQKGRTRTNRQAEGQASGERIQPDLRHRLSRHLRTSRQTRIDQNTPRNRGNSRIGDSSDGRCDGILGRRTRRGNLHGATGRIQGWNEGGRPRVQTQEKSLRPQASSKGLESENSGFPQVNRLRTNLLGSLRIHQQDDKNHHRNVGGRSHYFRKGYGQHQRSQSTAQRRVRNEGPRRAQILSRHTSPSGQGTKDHPHPPVRLQSNDSRTVRHAEQQTGKHSSFQQHSAHQSGNHGHSGRSEEVSKHGWQPHVRNASHKARLGAIDSTNLAILAETYDDSRKSGKASPSIRQRNNRSRNHVQRQSRTEVGMLERCELGRRRRTGIGIRIRLYFGGRRSHLLIEEARLGRTLQYGIGIHGYPSSPQGADLAPPLSQRNWLRRQQSKCHLLRQSKRNRPRT